MTPAVLHAAMIPVIGIAADFTGTLSLSDTSQLSARPALQAQGGVLTNAGTAFDAETAPGAGVGLHWRRSELTFGYAVHFTLKSIFNPDFHNPYDPDNPLIFHTGYAAYAFWGRHWRVTVSEMGTIGQQSFSNLSVPAAPNPNARVDPSASRIDFIPGLVQVVTIGASTTAIALNYEWSPRWTSVASVSYLLSGALHEYDQTTLPRIQTEAATLSLDYAASHRDHLASAVTISHSWTSTTNDYKSFTATETWTHAFTRNAGGQISAGVIAGRADERIPPGNTRNIHNFVYPTASAGLTGAIFLVRERDLSLSLILGTGLAPVINPLTGDLSERLQGSATLQLVKGKTTVAATVDGAQTFPIDDTQARIIGTGVIATHKPGKLVDIFAGYRRAWQVTGSASNIAPLPPQWIAYVGVTVRAPVLKF